MKTSFVCVSQSLRPQMAPVAPALAGTGNCSGNRGGLTGLPQAPAAPRGISRACPLPWARRALLAPPRAALSRVVSCTIRGSVVYKSSGLPRVVYRIALTPLTPAVWGKRRDLLGTNSVLDESHARSEDAATATSYHDHVRSFIAAFMRLISYAAKKERKKSRDAGLRCLHKSSDTA